MSDLMTLYLFKRMGYKGNLVVLTFMPQPEVNGENHDQIRDRDQDEAPVQVAGRCIHSGIHGRHRSGRMTPTKVPSVAGPF